MSKQRWWYIQPTNQLTLRWYRMAACTARYAQRRAVKVQRKWTVNKWVLTRVEECRWHDTGVFWCHLVDIWFSLSEDLQRLKVAGVLQTNTISDVTWGKLSIRSDSIRLSTEWTILQFTPYKKCRKIQCTFIKIWYWKLFNVSDFVQWLCLGMDLKNGAAFACYKHLKLWHFCRK